MSSSLWSNSGSKAVIVNESGVPIWCDACPCDEEEIDGYYCARWTIWENPDGELPIDCDPAYSCRTRIVYTHSSSLLAYYAPLGECNIKFGAYGYYAEMMEILSGPHESDPGCRTWWGGCE